MDGLDPGMENLPAFTHVDEVQAFDGHDIEDWTLHVVRLDAGGDPDVFLNADVTPVFGRNYERAISGACPHPRPTPRNPLRATCEDGSEVPHTRPRAGSAG